MKRPLILLAVLVPVHLVAQHLLLSGVVRPLLVLPVVAVAAFEAADRAAARYAARRPQT